MSNLAYLSDYKPPADQGGKMAQLEDGYLRIANELIDAVMCAGLSETELCIVLAVWRKTYGYSKKTDWISNDKLSEMIGKHFTHCSSAKNSLISKKVLIQQGRKVGMNTNLAEWETKNNGFCKTLAKPAKKTLAEVAKRPKQKLLNTKDNNTKDNKDNINNPPKAPLVSNKKFDPMDIQVPAFLDPKSWSEWVEYRRQSGKPIKTSVTVTKAFKLLRECYDDGHNPSDVIDSSIANGYQGLFKPKNKLTTPYREQQNTPHWNSPESWEDFI